MYRFVSLSLVLVTSVVVPASADVVIDWNNVLIQAVRADSSQPGPGWASRNFAMLHAAIFDAVNSIDHRYESYHADIDAPSWTSAEAAAAEVAYKVLVHLYPDQKATFDEALASSLDDV